MTIWRAAVIGFACFATYTNGLAGPFIYDDELSIVENRHLRDLTSLDVLSAEQDSPTAGRPLVNLSFAVNYAWSGLNARPYRATNLLIHTLAALLVFGVIRRPQRLSLPVDGSDQAATNVAFAAALIWAVHPLNSEVVDYITQRTESMMALFYLATVYASVRAADSGRARRWQALAVVCCALGMACKESMATAPAVVLLYDRVYLFRSFRQAFARRGWFYLALSATWLLLVVLMWSAPRGESAGFTSGVEPWTYLLNQAVIITAYLQRALWPQSLVAGYGWMQPLVLSDVVPAAALILLLLMLSAAALVLKPTLGFWAAWFFITLSPTSSLVPIPIEVGAERRMYLPLVGLVTLVVTGGAKLLGGGERRRAPRAPVLVRRRWQLGAVALTAVTVVLSTGTIIRNREYASEVSLYRTVVDRWPTSLSHHILGSALMEAGSHQEATVHLRAALPGAPRAHYDLGVALFNENKLDEAVGHLQNLIAIWESPPAVHPYWQAPVRRDAVEARLLMGRAFALQQRWSEASQQFERVLSLEPAHTEARRLLATSLFSAGLLDQAAIHYATYVATRRDDVDALTNFGIALAAAGKNDEAVLQFRQAVAVDPKNGRSHRNLANALADAKDYDEAAAHAATAVSLRPDDPLALDLLGRLLAYQGKLSDAASTFERALQLDPDYTEARQHLAAVRSAARGTR